jgi:hypothetical protein
MTTIDSVRSFGKQTLFRQDKLSFRNGLMDFLSTEKFTIKIVLQDLLLFASYQYHQNPYKQLKHLYLKEKHYSWLGQYLY